MQNDFICDYNSLQRRPSRFRRIGSSSIKDITKTIDKNIRNTSIALKQLHTIETDGPLRNIKVKELNKNCRLPELVLVKGFSNIRTIEIKDISRKMSLNRGINRVDQFQDLFPRRASDIQEKYSITEPSQLRSATNVTIKRRNNPKILKSNFPFGDEIQIRKPFSQQVKKRTILEPKNLNKNEFLKEFNSVQEGLFTFYPKDTNQQQMINQFLQIQ